MALASVSRPPPLMNGVARATAVSQRGATRFKVSIRPPVAMHQLFEGLNALRIDLHDMLAVTQAIRLCGERPSAAHDWAHPASLLDADLDFPDPEHTGDVTSRVG
jgi:hypothetical protein